MRSEALRGRLAAAGLLAAWPDGMPAAFADVTADSRQVRPGALFAAWAGTATDAHDFLGAAREAGAAAALVERAVLDVPLPQVVVTNGRRAAAVAAALCCDDPAAVLRLVAVTGTNGKTTSVHLLRHLLGADAPAGSIGTLGAVDGTGRVIPGTEALTTPGPVELQRTLARLREDGVRTVAMEASSHSLHQDRLYGLRFHAAVYTNFTRDHLDYHATEAAYLEAKLSLSTYLAAGGVEVVHADDPAWRALPPHTPRVTFSARGAADVRADAVAGDAAGTRFTLHHGARAAAVALPLLGAFNVENAVGAAAAALALGVPLEVVAERLGTASQVPGRMERLTTTPCPVLRDYAHTPDALERAITALRPLTGGRLIVVFGCGGDRDRGKRPVMGGIAARLADLPIVTSDNPRTEDPDRILDDIEEGMGETPHLRIVNRRKAIHRAIAIARPDDTVLLAGKGHETYQVVGRDKLPFDEGMIVAEAVAATVR